MNERCLGSLLPRGALDRPTKSQLLVLEWEADSLAELELQTGLIGAALLSVINACKRRGWLDDKGHRTELGGVAMHRPVKR